MKSKTQDNRADGWIEILFNSQLLDLDNTTKILFPTAHGLTALTLYTLDY